MSRFLKVTVFCISFVALMISGNACEEKTPELIRHATVRLQQAFPNLRFPQPVDVQTPRDGTNRLFVVSQSGVIHVFNAADSTPTSSEFLNIGSRVVSGGELGLLGLAFHPQFNSNGYFFVNYTTGNPLRTVIARFSLSSTNPNQADASSEVILLEVQQPYENHNGGGLAFGPDGLLYIALGDGGSAGDPHNNGQSLRTLLGKILRIDVRQSGQAYSIPADNPFVGDTTARGEIFAFGLRNPWRISFDDAGRLWTSDVGQNIWEEVDMIEKGKNYGWKIMEGSHCFSPSRGCLTDGLTMPVWEYQHSTEEGCSVTGGYVYRGTRAPSLSGLYIYGDYCSGRIWALRLDGENRGTNGVLLDSKLAVSSFGVDERDNLYVCSYDDGTLFVFAE